MGLAGRVQDPGFALRKRRRHHRVLRRRDRRLVQEDLGPAQATAGRVDAALQAAPRAERDVGAQGFERQHMGVEAPATDHVSTGRRHADPPATREERARQQDRGADRAAEFRIGIVVAQTRGGDPDRVVAHDFSVGPELTEQPDLCFHIPDSRHVGERDLVVGEQRRGQHRQCRVLVAARLKRARDRVAALDHEPGTRHVCKVVHRTSS